MEGSKQRPLASLHDHSLFVVVVVMTNQVQRAVDNKQREFVVEVMTVPNGVGGDQWADHHIADHWWSMLIDPRGGCRICSNQVRKVERECEDIGRTVFAHVQRIQLCHVGSVDKTKTDFAVAGNTFVHKCLPEQQCPTVEIERDEVLLI